MSYYLSIILFTPLAGALLLLFVNKRQEDAIRWIANVVAFIGFAVSIPLWFWYNPQNPDFQFVERAPWIAGLVFMVTFLVFVTPIVIAALVIWYKVRKSRMMNETMLRLAEKGVVPPPEAFDAISGNRANPMGGPATAPLYEQAKAVRQKAVWSDLRKGIIVGAVGLGFTFYSMLDDGSPNFVGLVLLFVGLAYIVLWYFEDRQITAARGGLPPPPPPPPSA